MPNRTAEGRRLCTGTGTGTGPATGRATRRALAAALALLLAWTALPTASADPVLAPRACAWPIRTDSTMANYAFPDTHATYFIRPAWLGAGDELVIRGTDPDARYWSLQTYRFGDSTWLDGVNDADVVRGPDGSWTVRVATVDDPTDANVLVMPQQTQSPPSLGELGILIYRVYAPDSGGAAGGPLPTVRTRSAAGAEADLVPCAPAEVTPPQNDPVLSPITGATRVFTRGPASAVYPSTDTAYLGAAAPYRAGHVLVVTGRAPAVPRQVRYWSLCQNVNAGLLPVVDCVDDREVPRRRDGTYAVAVVGPGQVSARQRRQFDSVAFLEWAPAGDAGPLADAFLIYRTILPAAGFDRAAQDVREGRAGPAEIGAFSPRLRYVPLQRFLRAWRG